MQGFQLLTDQISGNVWTSNEPRPKHNCAKISIPNHGWTTDDCLNRNPTICQNCTYYICVCYIYVLQIFMC